VLAALAVFVVPIAVSAAGGFTDVADDNIFKADIEWMAANDITRGCNPPTNDKFCPSSVVTRETMSAFMHRLGVNKVVDAATAVEADNADTLDGNAPADLTSDAFSTFKDAAVPMPSAYGTVLELKNLPAGNYVFMAKTYMQSDAQQGVACRLVAGDQWDQVVATLEAFHNVPAAFNVVANIASDGGSAVLQCQDFGASANVFHTKITAIGVDGLTNTSG
jgi:hypothetical protein